MRYTLVLITKSLQEHTHDMILHSNLFIEHFMILHTQINKYRYNRLFHLVVTFFSFHWIEYFQYSALNIRFVILVTEVIFNYFQIYFSSYTICSESLVFNERFYLKSLHKITQFLNYFGLQSLL